MRGSRSKLTEHADSSPHVPGRTLAIGDIHGCLDKLDALLEKISPGPADTLIFLGDYIDRGPSPKEVIDRLIELTPQCRCIFLRGNHEDMFLQFLEWGDNREMYLINGGDTTLKSYCGEKILAHSVVARSLPMEHRTFFERLRWHHEDEHYIYVHAGLKPGVALNRQDHYDLIWIREGFIHQPTLCEKKVIFAHTPSHAPLVQPDKIGIDTGAVYGGALTAIELPAERFIQAP